MTTIMDRKLLLRLLTQIDEDLADLQQVQEEFEVKPGASRSYRSVTRLEYTAAEVSVWMEHLQTRRRYIADQLAKERPFSL